MDSETESLEERLNTFLVHLQTECGILKKMVHKNSNQQKSQSYFKYLKKVQRDLRLLQSAKLDETLASCFIVIAGKRPEQMVHLLESLKIRRCEDGRRHFRDRLLGAARLLSEMVEPMLKAATKVSIEIARGRFLGIYMTILALLARLRTLVQQILVDVVSVYNIVTSLSRKRQSVKINQEGIEVFWEVYPPSEDFIMLESVWKTDNFILVEKKCKSEIKNQDEPTKSLAVCYQTVEPFLGDDMPTPMKTETYNATNEVSTSEIESDKGKQLEEFPKKLDNAQLDENPSHNHPVEDILYESSIP